ncbi:hypothetical protein HOD96_00020 [Candidatus Falkowbacteria bacterium]|jgi:hypothetical protein|nr:hypothetical protein [Candidatus Falkowbacteria bacterium]MBT4432795.1 hypothetical protein [Candidatus Falkowbacteria bacterium]
MKFETLATGEELKQGTNKLEKLNQEIESSDLSVEEKEAKLEEATRIEGQLDYFEQELGIDPEEVLKIYESLTPETAQEEIKEIDPNLLESIKNDSKEFMTKLGEMAKNKCTRVVAAILAAGIISVGNYTPEFGVTVNEASAIEQVDKKFTKKQQENVKLFKGWAAEMSAEGVFTDKELANMSVYGGRYDKAYELFEKKIRFRLLQDKTREQSKQQGTYKQFTDEKGKVYEEMSAEEVDLNQGISKKAEQEKGELIVSKYFTSDGKEQFIKAMKTKAGEQAEEAYKYNMVTVIKPEFNAYFSGSITETEFLGWVEKFNAALKKLGATSDVIDVQKIPKLKQGKVIQGQAADLDAL